VLADEVTGVELVIGTLLLENGTLEDDCMVDGMELEGYEVVRGILMEELETVDDMTGVELVTGTLLLEKGTVDEDWIVDGIELDGYEVVKGMLMDELLEELDDVDDAVVEQYEEQV